MTESYDPMDATRRSLSRRAFLGLSAATLGIHSLLGRAALARIAGEESGSERWRLPEARARRVVMVFLNGGVSQLDLFDDKPLLRERRGEEIPESVHKHKGIVNATARRGAFPAVGSSFRFKSYGDCGRRLSELIPTIGSVADRFSLIKTLQTDHVLHETAITTLMTGTPLLDRPSWGSWVTYALGSANRDLPAFVVLNSNGQGDSPLQPRLWGSGFLPGRLAGVPFRSGASPVLDVARPPGVSEAARRSQLDALAALNGLEYDTARDPDVLTRIESYEMAARMQVSVPDLADLRSEPDRVLERYGADRAEPSFARNCVLARRLLERGVRFVQLCDGGWDHHGGLTRQLPRKCEQVDRGIGELIRDLDDRGLLDETVVIVSGEFGRTPHCDGPLGHDRYGRDHHNLAFSAIVAGGGFRRGSEYGRTDDWGWDVVENPVHVHDLQATVLHQLGIDHERLTHRHEGRDFRLTDTGGRVIDDLLA